MKRFLFLFGLFALVACATSQNEGEATLPAETVAIEEQPATTVPVASAEPSEDQPTEVPTSSPTATTVAEAVEDAFEIAGTIAEAGQIRDHDWVKGNPSAEVVVVEYGDFQ